MPASVDETKVVQFRHMSASKTVAIVIPAKDEAAAIGYVLRQIPSEIAGMSVTAIVIDDGSIDGTAEIAARNGARVFRHMINLGVGSATITGFRAAEMIGADVVVTIDADGQHDPGEIDRLVSCLINDELDVVIGSRILQPRGMPVTRIFANLLLNGVTFIVYGKIVSDSQSGFKAFSRDALKKIDLRSTGYEICSEIIGEIYRKDLRYKSLPVRAVYTDYSRAKGQHFLNGINLILGLLMRWLRRV